MAEGGYKPSELYLGVKDLFAILLPGSILTFLITQAVPLLLKLGDALKEQVPRYFAFLVVSYVIGHLLEASSAPLFDHLYHRWYKSRDPERERCNKQVKKVLADSLGLDEGDNAMHWSVAVLAVKAPQTAELLDRLDADAKFFRSIALVLLLVWPLQAFAHSTNRAAVSATLVVLILMITQVSTWAMDKKQRKGKPWVEAMHKWLLWAPVFWLVPVIVVCFFFGHQDNFFLTGVVCYAGSLAAASRYMWLRSKQTQKAYQLVVTLLRLGP